jgi:hypothetical protein
MDIHSNEGRYSPVEMNILNDIMHEKETTEKSKELLNKDELRKPFNFLVNCRHLFVHQQDHLLRLS